MDKEIATQVRKNNNEINYAQQDGLDVALFQPHLKGLPKSIMTSKAFNYETNQQPKQQWQNSTK